MKAKIVKQEVVFTPVTIQITFDTLEELEVFVDTVGYNESIPELVTAHTPMCDKQQKYEISQNILTILHRAAVNAMMIENEKKA